MKKLTYYIAFVIGIMPVLVPIQAFAQSGVPGSLPLMISEVQTGGRAASEEGSPELPGQEFIELYNPDDTAYSMEGVDVEYLSAAHDGTGPPTRTIARLTGVLPPQHFYLISAPDYLAEADALLLVPSDSRLGVMARTAGHIRLVDTDTSLTLDLLTWGSGVPIGQWPRVASIPPGSSVQRVLPGDEGYDGSPTYMPLGLPMTPFSGRRAPSPDPDTGCRNIMLSELLPNAAGADAGKEFIEIYNPTEASIPLLGCTIRAGNKVFALADEELPPQSYRAFTDTETGISLPNASAIAVTLTTIVGEQTVLYGNDLADDYAWAFIGSVWQTTSLPTPGQANMLPENPPVATDTDVTDPSPLQPCDPGKERNPETKRCRTIATVAAPTPCKSGQQRSPVTNRCRTIAAVAGASLAVCKPGQQRNPETNRCRSTATTSVTACAPGQQRNPSTNRCRKIPASGGKVAQVQDITASSLTNNYRWWLVGAVVVVALSYGIYEWRQEVGRLLERLNVRSTRGK